MKKSKNITDVLTQWGIWANSQRAVRLGYTKPFAGMISKRGEITPEISDEDALEVDRAVAALGCRNKKMREILFYTFVLNWGMREVALRLGTSPYLAGKACERAKGWVECRLFGDDETFCEELLAVC